MDPVVTLVNPIEGVYISDVSKIEFNITKETIPEVSEDEEQTQ